MTTALTMIASWIIAPSLSYHAITTTDPVLLPNNRWLATESWRTHVSSTVRVLVRPGYPVENLEAIGQPTFISLPDELDTIKSPFASPDKLTIRAFRRADRMLELDMRATIPESRGFDLYMWSHGWPIRTTHAARFGFAYENGTPLPGAISVGNGFVNVEERGFVKLPTRKGIRFKSRTITTIPIWTGVIANVIIFSLAWAGFFAMTRASIGACRHRRGLCPRCKYDLHHDHAAGCPECGWNRPAPEAEHAPA